MTSQHTKGKWTADINKKNPPHRPMVVDDHGCQIAMMNKYQPQFEANAKLIAETGTVTNETGFTPRQLADQKAELLEALKKAHDWAKSDKSPMDYPFDLVKATIKKANIMKREITVDGHKYDIGVDWNLPPEQKQRLEEGKLYEADGEGNWMEVHPEREKKMVAAIKKALSVKALWMNPIVNSAGERTILNVLLKQFEEAIL